MADNSSKAAPANNLVTITTDQLSQLLIYAHDQQRTTNLEALKELLAKLKVVREAPKLSSSTSSTTSTSAWIRSIFPGETNFEEEDGMCAALGLNTVADLKHKAKSDQSFSAVFLTGDPNRASVLNAAIASLDDKTTPNDPEEQHIVKFSEKVLFMISQPDNFLPSTKQLYDLLEFILTSENKYVGINIINTNSAVSTLVTTYLKTVNLPLATEPSRTLMLTTILKILSIILPIYLPLLTDKDLSALQQEKFYQHVCFGDFDNGAINKELTLKIVRSLCAYDTISMAHNPKFFTKFVLRGLYANFETRSSQHYEIMSPVFNCIVDIADKFHHWRVWLALHSGKGGLIDLLHTHKDKLQVRFLAKWASYLWQVVESNQVVAAYCWFYDDVRYKIRTFISACATRLKSPSTKESPEVEIMLKDVLFSQQNFELIWAKKKEIGCDFETYKQGFNPGICDSINS